MDLRGEVRCLEKSYAGGRQKPTIGNDNDDWCLIAWASVSSLDAIDVVDAAGVGWSSCLIRHMEEQNAEPPVSRSQNKQKSPREKSMFLVLCRAAEDG